MPLAAIAIRQTVLSDGRRRKEPRRGSLAGIGIQSARCSVSKNPSLFKCFDPISKTGGGGRSCGAAASQRAASSGTAPMWGSRTSRITAAWWHTPLVSMAPVSNAGCTLHEKLNGICRRLQWQRPKCKNSGPPELCAGSRDGGLYIAFNTSHRPAVVDLPHWAGRRWQLYADSSKVRTVLWLRGSHDATTGRQWWICRTGSAAAGSCAPTPARSIEKTQYFAQEAYP